MNSKVFFSLFLLQRTRLLVLEKESGGNRTHVSIGIAVDRFLVLALNPEIHVDNVCNDAETFERLESETLI